MHTLHNIERIFYKNDKISNLEAGNIFSDISKDKIAVGLSFCLLFKAIREEFMLLQCVLYGKQTYVMFFFCFQVSTAKIFLSKTYRIAVFLMKHVYT